jgi:hypothetical protein
MLSGTPVTKAEAARPLATKTCNQPTGKLQLMRSFRIFCYALLLGLLLLSALPVALIAQSPAQKGFNPDSVFADLGLDGEGANSVLGHGESSREKIAGNIFIRGSVSKSICYPGQPVLLTYQLYSALQSSSHISILPALPNCNAIEWPVSNEKVTRRRFGGKEYRVLTIWQVRLLPFREGAITIDSLSVDNDITYTTASGKTGHYSGRTSSSPVTLNILPLPVNGRPPGFSGSIGNYQIHAAVRSARIQAGETDTLHIEISGSGNLDNITFPAIAWPKGIEFFPSRQRWKIDKDRFPPTGYTSISIPFVAALPGRRVLPPVSFSYFDASLAAYKTIHSDSLALDILPAAAKALPDRVTTASPTGALITGGPQPSSFRTYGWAIGSLLFLAGCAAWFYYRQKRRRIPLIPATTDLAASPADPEADPDTHFRTTLEQLTGSPDPTGFYPGLKIWLDSFLQSRLVTRSCSEADLLALLRAHTGENDLLGKVSFIYRSCGEFQYSPAGTEAAVSELSGFAWTILEKVPANIYNTYSG